MFISELAKKTGLTVHTIRFYEEEGLLDTRHVQRGANNYRSYSPEAIERLKLIKQAQATGFTIIELKELAEAYDAGTLSNEQQVVSLRRKVEAIGRTGTTSNDPSQQISSDGAERNGLCSSRRQRGLREICASFVSRWR
jgi:MerR family copper efflux transcriptional regulator